MRKALLTLALAGLITIPVAAQFRGGMGRGTGGNPLANKSVQAELKLTDKQKTDVAEIQKTSGTAMREALKGFRDDREKATAQMKKAGEASTKAYAKFAEGLTSVQKQRLSEIKIQLAAKAKSLGLFTNEDALKVLKLTPKQKDSLKEAVSELEKDSKELRDDAKGDRKKLRETQTKINSLRTEAFEKVMKSLTDDQTKALTAAQGKAFEYKSDRGGFGRDGGKGGKGGRKGGKKKTDDI